MMMSRCVVAAVVVVVAVCCNVMVNAEPTKYNVILLMSDDMGIGDVGFNNHTLYNPGAGNQTWIPNPPETPNLNAMAASPNSIVFRQFRSGSPVCSPTRASCLTGRTPDRECIYSAEGCGSKPAAECSGPYPLPTSTFTIAQAAKAAGYATTHIGKYHLGDFWPKGLGKPNYAQKKWPAAHPGLHGFDEWHSTEASAPSSTTNCGCNASWAHEGQGCIVGGGDWEPEALTCTNYWHPTDLDSHHKPYIPSCHNVSTTSFACVANLTEKVPGDDSEFIMDQFEDFLVRKTSGPEKAPFLAVLWLHTNHVPHPSLPQYYHAYLDAEGNPAGDYLGTITQMDVQIGRLRSLLKQHGVAEDTMLWMTADNGAHTESEQGDRISNQASNGLRQCKASIFEGGIRVPGIVEFPALIKENRVTDFPAATFDYLPTFLDFLEMENPNKGWAVDGMSLRPLLENKPITRKPMGFKLGSQVAYIDGDLKIVSHPEKGQCKTFLPPWDKAGPGPFLFNLTADPTESHDLSKTQPDDFARMTQEMNDFVASIDHSRYYESQCAPAPSPTPTPVPGYTIKTSTGECLSTSGEHMAVSASAAACTSEDAKWFTRPDGGIAHAADSTVLKVDKNGVKDPCAAGNTVYTGAFMADDFAEWSSGAGTISVASACPNMCAGLSSGGDKLQVVDCASATRFTKG